MESYKVSPYFILDYTNKLYDNGLALPTRRRAGGLRELGLGGGRAFRGAGHHLGIVQRAEFSFLAPKPNVHDYILLAFEVGRPFALWHPQERYVGPATALIDFGFLAACFKAGLLNYWSAVSVHPYRQRDPESVAEEFHTLQRVIAGFCPPGKPVPVIAGESGYSSTWNWKGMDEAKQGKLLPREFLSNLAEGVPLTIWYDWHDDSSNPQDPESHFGIVHFPYSADSRPVYSPKPAYLALKTLSGVLDGYRFTGRLPVGGANDYVLSVTKGTEIRLAAWTTSAPHERPPYLTSEASLQLPITSASVSSQPELTRGNSDYPDRCAAIPGSGNRLESAALRTTGSRGSAVSQIECSADLQSLP